MRRRKRFRMVCYNPGSQSAKRVANELAVRLGRKVLRSRKPRKRRINLFYGNPMDKLSQYQWFSDNDIPTFTYTTEQEIAKEWARKGKVVMCRKLTRASGGAGIVVARTPEEVVRAPLYTRYKQKKYEYRVHIFKDKVVAVLQKRRRKEFDGERESCVRNKANGYVFCRENVVRIPGIEELALKASKISQSDFKGVDIGFNEKTNSLFVIEVNSAPGVENTNVKLYCDEILRQYPDVVKRKKLQYRRLF